MAGQRAMFTGVDAILSGWDTFIQKYPYYALANGGGIIWQGDGSSASRRELEDMLDASEQSNNSDLYHLYFYGTGTPEPVTNKTPFTSKCPVRVVDGPMGRGVVGSVREGDLPQVVYRAFQEMEKVPAMLTAMQAEINALKNAEVVETTVLGKIGSFLQTPEFLNSPVGAMAVEKLFGLIGLVGGKSPVNNMAIGNIPQSNTATMDKNKTGVDDAPQDMTEEQIMQLDTIISRLSKHCDVLADLDKLASIAETNPSFFNGILSHLRSM